MLVALPRGAKDLSKHPPFGKLKPQYIVGVVKGRGLVWRCLCECGRAHDALAAELLRGNTRQCGECVRGARSVNMRLVGSYERAAPEAPNAPGWREALADLTDAQRARCVEILRARWRRGVQITDEMRAEAIEISRMEVAA